MTCNENKVVFVGQSGTGKSSILERFTQNSFTSYTESTIGASFAVGTITLDQKKNQNRFLGYCRTRKIQFSRSPILQRR